MKTFKSFLIGVLATLLAGVSLVGLTACMDDQSSVPESSSSVEEVHEHEWGATDVTKAATCVEDGAMKVSCKGCSETYTITIPAVGHDLEDFDSKEVTCMEGGWASYQECTKCKYTTKVELAPNDNHDFKEYDRQEATCIAEGWTGFKECQREGCGVTVDRVQIPVAENIEDRNHAVIENEGREATCKVEGYDAFITCELCDYTTKQEPAINEDNHKNVTPYEGLVATCVTKGYDAYFICDDCGYSSKGEEKFDDKNHAWVPVDRQEATCVATGWEAYERCNREGCKVSTYEPELQIPVNPDNHDLTARNRKCQREGCDFKQEFSEGLTYALAADGASYIVANLGACTDIDIAIPAVHKEADGVELPVTGIGEGAFKNYIDLTNITMPNSVTSIGAEAFYGCANLANYILPDCVTEVGNKAFYGCSSLENIIIPNGVLSIGDFAFYNAGLVVVAIPASVTTIGEGAFCCENLMNITVDSNNTAYCASNGALYDKAVTELLQYAMGKFRAESFEILDGVTTIGAYAFHKGADWKLSSLENIIVPASVVTVKASFDSFASINIYYKGTIENWCGITFERDKYDSDAEFDCNAGFNLYIDDNKVTDVVIPDTVTELKGQFAYCDSIESVTIPGSITDIANNAFLNCANLKKVVISDGVAKVGEYVFAGCSSLAEVEFAGSVLSIEKYAFENCSSLAEVTIAEGVTEIKESAFVGCNSLKKVVLPKSITNIAKNAFSGCVIEDVYYAGSVAEWCGITFEDMMASPLNYGSKLYVNGNQLLTEKIIPESVTEIKAYAFANCTSLTSVSIPATVTTIGDMAFYGCKNLQNISVDQDNANYAEIDGNLYTKDEKVLIQYAIGKKDALVIAESVEKIEAQAFFGCENLAEVTFANTDGWSAKITTEEGEEVVAITAEDLADPVKAASYLTSEYQGYTWVREVVSADEGAGESAGDSVAPLV